MILCFILGMAYYHFLIVSEGTSLESDWEPVEAYKPSQPGAVYSIRFTGPELARLRAVARREGIRISDVIRQAGNGAQP